MSSIMRRRRGLKSAISILLSEGVGSNTHILSARRRSTPPCPLRRGSGFVQSKNEIAGFRGLKPPIPAISNAAKSEKQTPAQSLRALFTDDQRQLRSVVHCL